MKCVGNSQYQKAANALLILKLLRTKPCSRTEIAQVLGLQHSTVTYSVNRLLANGTVRELDQEPAKDNTLGRKRSLLGLNADFGHVVGIELLANDYRICVCDIVGNVVYQDTHSYHAKLVSTDSVEVFKQLVCEVITHAQQLCKEHSLLGVCIAIPGMVLDGDAFIGSCWTHALEQVDLSLWLQRFDFPVFFENDANCCAVRYLWKKGGSQENFLYLHSRKYDKADVPAGIPTVGIGLGVVLAGKLYRGSTGRSGEYRGSRMLGCDEDAQVSFDDEMLQQVGTDLSVSRALVLEVFADMFCTMSVFDPKVLYVGGFLAQEWYRELVLDVLGNELKDRQVGFLANGGNICISDACFDVCQGAATALLERLYAVPQVGENDSRCLSGLLVDIAK